MPLAASCAVVFWMSSSPYTVSSAYLRVSLAAACTAFVSMPAKLMVFMNLSVLSDMFTTSLVKPFTVSHSAVTPLTANPPMALPKAAAFVVVFSNALTASSALPVMRTLMIALCAMVHSFDVSSASLSSSASPVPQSNSSASFLHCHGVPPKRLASRNERRPSESWGHAASP